MACEAWRLGAWGPLGSPHQWPGPRCPCGSRFCLEKPLERTLQVLQPHVRMGSAAALVRLLLFHNQRS